MIRTGISNLIFSCFVALVLLIPIRSFGWGKDGHAAIVRLAFQLMPPEQRARLYAILDTTDPYYIGNWADWFARKEYPESAPWHYVNIPPVATQYVPSRDCGNDGCILSELPILEQELNKKRLSFTKRREDMLYYFHFLGDLYQPFHNLGPTGATDIIVKWHGEKRTLHRVWDENIILDHDIDTISLLKLARTMQSKPLEADYAKIAMEGHDIAVQNLVDSGTRLPTNYTEQKWPIVEHALIEAALQIVARTKNM
ncbi:MAG TPA: S1/P1 nuclease [Candidatus Kapabacteria bacterium]|jgi:hypothetical protein|nr:S1/P1 nuclease [Candidatus Kapabacteria bacterium]